MNIKRLLKPTLVFGAGVVVGLLGPRFLQFWSGEAFSFRSAPMDATPATGQTSERVTVELGSDAYHGVTIRRGGEQEVIPPPPQVIWSKMAVAMSANTAYLLAHDEVSHRMYYPRSLVRLSLPKSGEPLSSYTVTEILKAPAISNLVGAALIDDMEGVSKDGKRLLLRLGLKDQSNSSAHALYFTWKTYYYYPDENRLDEISP